MVNVEKLFEWKQPLRQFNGDNLLTWFMVGSWYKEYLFGQVCLKHASFFFESDSRNISQNAATNCSHTGLFAANIPCTNSIDCR